MSRPEEFAKDSHGQHGGVFYIQLDGESS